MIGRLLLSFLIFISSYNLAFSSEIQSKIELGSMEINGEEIEISINQALSKYHDYFFSQNLDSSNQLTITAKTLNENIILKGLLKISDKEYLSHMVIDSQDKIDFAVKNLLGRVYIKAKRIDFPDLKIKKVSKSKKGYISLESGRPIKSKDSIFLLRSTRKNGIYNSIEFTIKKNIIYDKSTKAGVEYWYKLVSNYHGVIANNHSLPLYGYSRPPFPAGESINKLIKDRQRTTPPYKNKAEKSKAKKDIAFLKSYYLHPVKLNLTLNISKEYIKNKQLLVFSDVKNFKFDKKQKTIEISEPDRKFYITFKTNKFFKMLKKNNDVVLFNRLVNNGVIYAMPSGEKRIVKEGGAAYYLPFFKAFGMSTSYHKLDKNWKKNTIMFGTSDSKLKKKMTEAQKRSMRKRSRRRR